MFVKRAVAVLAAGFFMVSAQANDAPAESKPEPAKADEMVCTYEKTTGSHMKRKVCMTRAAREEQAADSQKAMQQMRSPAGTRGTSGQ